MKKYLLMAALLFAAGTATQAQAYLGIGTGTCHNTWIINLQGGYQAKHFIAELEMKAPPISQQVNRPAVFAAKAGYTVNLKNNWLVVPYLQYSYQYYSADGFKTVTWQNGCKTGAGVRLQHGNVFVQADHIKDNYFCIGVIKSLGR